MKREIKTTLAIDGEDKFKREMADAARQLRVLNSEMKANTAAFGENAKSMEALTSKGKNLEKQIAQQKEIMKALAKAVEDSADKYGEADKRTDGYRIKLNNAAAALAKMEQATEQNSKAITELSRDTEKAANKMEKLRVKAKEMSESLKGVGDKISSIGQNMSIGLTAPIVAGFGLVTQGTKELRGDLARLTTNAGTAGQDMGILNDAMAKLQAVTHETDSNVEGLSNLLATGFRNEQLTTLLDSLYGASIKFSDTLKFEGISDGLQETLATGAAIGPFGELLERSGIVLDNFNAGLATAIANGTKEQYVLDVLAKTGLADTYKAYRKNNEEMVKAEEANFRMQQSMAKLGATLEPVLTPFIEGLTKIINKFNEMDPTAQKTILTLAGIAAAIGPTTWAIGGTVKGVGLLTSGIGKLTKLLGPASKAAGAVGETSIIAARGISAAAVATEGIGAASTVAVGTAGAGGLAGLGASLGAAAVAAGPWLIAGAAVVGTGYLVNKAMSEEAIPAVDLFADSVEKTAKKVVDVDGEIITSVKETTVQISEGTKQAIGAYIKMDEEVQKTIDDLYVNSSKITEATADSIVANFNSMGAKIKTGMDQRNAEQLTQMQEFFTKSNTLSDAEEAQVLAKMKTSNEAKKAEIDRYNQRVNEIMADMKNKNCEMTLAEQQELATIREGMKTQAVTALSQQELESKVILERMKSYGARITAEEAGEIIRNANDARDKSIAAANQQYNQTVASIIRERDETGTLSFEQAEKMISEAGRQRDESIAKAQELKEGVVGKFKEANKEIADQIDDNGNIKDAWIRLGDWFANNPITRWIKTTWINDTGTSQNAEGVYVPEFMPDSNAIGTSSFKGGLTYLNERGYELYDLPKGTRIYNHDASEDLVRKTAESVARQVLAGTGGSNFNGPLLQVDKMVIANDMDIQTLANKLEFYRGQVARARGTA